MSHVALTPSSITPLRQKIDDIDKQIIALLTQRLDACRAIGALKKSHNTAVFMRTLREYEVLNALRQAPTTCYPFLALFRMWRELITSTLVMENGLQLVTTDHPQTVVALRHVIDTHFSQLVAVTPCASRDQFYQTLAEDLRFVGIQLIDQPTAPNWWCQIPTSVFVIGQLPFASGVCAPALLLAGGEIDEGDAAHTIAIVHAHQLQPFMHMLAHHDQQHLVYYPTAQQPHVQTVRVLGRVQPQIILDQ